MNEHVVILKFKCPDTVSRAELRSFITDALTSWGGQRHPADHLFHSLQKVNVRFDGAAPSVPRKEREAYFRNLNALIGGGYS